MLHSPLSLYIDTVSFFLTLEVAGQTTEGNLISFRTHPPFLFLSRSKKKNSFPIFYQKNPNMQKKLKNTQIQQLLIFALFALFFLMNRCMCVFVCIQIILLNHLKVSCQHNILLLNTPGYISKEKDFLKINEFPNMLQCLLCIQMSPVVLFTHIVFCSLKKTPKESKIQSHCIWFLCVFTLF